MNYRHICIISEGYPTAEDPFFTFVRQLVVAIADQGIKCSVIAPQSLTKSLIRNKKRRPFYWVDKTQNDSEIDIYQPSFVSISNFKMLNMSLTRLLWQNAIIRTFEKIKVQPTVIYGHFWHSGIVASKISHKHNIPAFVASGESKITVQETYSDAILKRNLHRIDGVICVSNKNLYESLELNLAPKEKMTVIPNAIDKNSFYFIDKNEARRKLGINEEDFIVAFTGAFNERKGVLRLTEALKKVKGVKSIFIGSGEMTPEGEGILFCGKLPHNQIVHYLNAADVFVLPTIAEGCCNAIIEAMACGLPIISSDQSFNDDILDEKNSIRINSNDIEKIAEAIRLLKDNTEIREAMSKASLNIAGKLDIETRAKRVVQYIEQQSGGISCS